MDDFELPDDLKDEVEVIYLDNEDDEIENNIEFEGDYDEQDLTDGGADIADVEVNDISRLSFTQHKKSVFSSDISKDMQITVTGGEDDMAYVWQVATGEVILECTGHKDSVTEVGFNNDNTYVATGDMAGMIQVWSLKDKKLIWCYEGDDMEWLSWHPIANVLISGSQSGDLYIWQLPQGNCKVLPSHGSSANCSKTLPDGKRIIVGYEDGQIKLWDIKSSTVLWQLSEPQTSGITDIDINQDGTVLIASPSAQLIKITDGKHVATLLNHGETAIETAIFSQELNVVVTGSLSGQLCVWDLGKNVLRHQACIEASVTVMKFGPNAKLFVGANDGAVYVCDIRTCTLLETLTGHRAAILSLSVSQDGKTVVSTSDDGTAKVFDIKC